MRVRIKFHIALFLTAAAVSLAPIALRAQDAGPKANPAPEPLRAELAIDYNYVRSNAPPGNCGCINLNGVNANFAWPVKPKSFALVADVSVTHAGSIGSNGFGLTLGTYTAGARYTVPSRHSSLQPFAQALVGLAHAGGTLVKGKTPAAQNADAAFAAIVGGGLDMRLSKRISLRMIEADYLVTTVDNGVNDHQNNLRVSAGVVFHF